MKILYTGFKGKHNTSFKLVSTFEGEKVFLTNSFNGLKTDIDNINEKFDWVYMFGLDKNLKESVRIEKCAEKERRRIYTTLDLESICKELSSENVNYFVSDEPTHYLCNEAYYYMLEKMSGKAVFIHIPSLKNMTEELMKKLSKSLDLTPRS